MKKKIYLFGLLTGLLLLLPPPVLAANAPWQISESDLKHARDADIHAGRDHWDDAITHAGRAADKTIADLFAWRRFNAKYGDPTFEQITSFLKKHPNWPEQEKMRTRAELLIFADTPRQKILDWFSDSVGGTALPTFRDPLTGSGKIALAQAILNSNLPPRNYQTQTSRWLREGWVNADFREKDEKTFLQRYGKKLRKEDHVARVDRLLWDGETDAAKRILDKTDPAHHKLFNARIHLQVYNFGIEEAIAAVPTELQRNDGLLYDRMKWREQKGKASGMLDLMVQVPSYTAHPRLWWPLRKKSINFLMEKKKYNIAYTLAKQHSFTDDTTGFADGEWLAGWIAFEYLKDYKTAYKHFYQLYRRVETPISAGRAAYWAARASEGSGYADIAKQWYTVCAQYPSSFYGQLGAQKIGYTTLPLPPQPEMDAQDQLRFQRNSAAKAAYLLYKLKQHGLARMFLQQAVKSAETPGEKRLIAELGYAVDRPDYTSYAAKEAVRNQGPLLINAHYPTLGVPLSGKPEDALVHAIVLQESIFLKDAESSVGALGLMQLMPATAKHIAKKTGQRYDKSALTSDRAYNVRLGSAYLQSLIDSFNGSYVLAITAYNGGPGNVNKWLKLNGDPRTMTRTEDIVAWIEKIPFPETQNYVQRVIENLQLYRAHLDPQNTPALSTAQDIAR